MSAGLKKKTGMVLLRGIVLLWAFASLCALNGTAAEERAVKTRVAPVYPELAKRMRISGMVRLEVTVDADGKVLDVKPVSGNHALSVAAEDAVRKWKFVPAAGPSTVDVELNFELAQ
jgi:TonB family protein